MTTEQRASAALHPPGSTASAGTYLRRLYAMRRYAWTDAKYRLSAETSNTVLGWLWYLIEPAAYITIFWFVFGFTLDVGRGTEDFVAFLTVGQLVYRHSVNAIQTSASALVTNQAIMRSFSFTRAVLPVTRILSAALRFRFSLVVMCLVLPLMGASIRWTWILILPVAAIQVLMNLGIGMLLAPAVTRFADIRRSMQFGFQILFYTSGVFFPLEPFVIDRPYGTTLLNLATLNPIYDLVQLARWAMLGMRPTNALVVCLATAAWTIGSLVVGFMVFLRSESRFGAAITVPVSP